MAKQDLRLALNAAAFPFLYSQSRRHVLAPSGDTAGRMPAGYSGAPDNIDWNVPQLIFCENVMPTSEGYVSTQTENKIAAHTPASDAFDQAITLRDAEEQTTLFVPARGLNYIFNPVDNEWVSTNPLGATWDYNLVTHAYVNGRHFVCYEKTAILEWDGVTRTFTDQTANFIFISGITMANIRGIGGSSNYLLFFTDIEVLGSSPNDQLAVDPTANDGSFRVIPQDIRGRINAIVGSAGGFIIYTSKNAVGATYTNNARTPFLYRGIDDAGGIPSYEQVAGESEQRVQYIWGSGGLQSVSFQRGEQVFPELSDFFTSQRWETYNYTTHSIDVEELGAYVDVKLTYVSNRFLVASVGRTAGVYEYAIIYDHALQRWGKIKETHTDCFIYPYPVVVGDLAYEELGTTYADLGSTTYAQLGVGVPSVAPPKRTIGFLKADGQVDVLVIDYRLRSAVGVAVVGKIQSTRSRMTTLHEVELEGIDPTVEPVLYDIISVNGKTVDRVATLVQTEVADEYRQYKCRHVGKNHTLALEGAFQLSGLVIHVANHGRT